MSGWPLRNLPHPTPSVQDISITLRVSLLFTWILLNFLSLRVSSSYSPYPANKVCGTGQVICSLTVHLPLAFYVLARNIGGREAISSLAKHHSCDKLSIF